MAPRLVYLWVVALLVAVCFWLIRIFKESLFITAIVLLCCIALTAALISVIFAIDPARIAPVRGISANFGLVEVPLTLVYVFYVM